MAVLGEVASGGLAETTQGFAGEYPRILAFLGRMERPFSLRAVMPPKDVDKLIPTVRIVK